MHTGITKAPMGGVKGGSGASFPLDAPTTLSSSSSSLAAAAAVQLSGSARANSLPSRTPPSTSASPATEGCGAHLPPLQHPPGVITMGHSGERFDTNTYKKYAIMDGMVLRAIPYDGKNPNNHNPTNNDPDYRNKSSNNSNGRRHAYLNPNLHPELMGNKEVLNTHADEHEGLEGAIAEELKRRPTGPADDGTAGTESQGGIRTAGDPYSTQEHILRHRSHFGTSGNKTHSVVIAFDTKYVEPVVEKALAADERREMKTQAISTYIFKKNALARRELEQVEEREREDLVGDMSCFFDAFMDWQKDVREGLFGKKTLQRALQRLQEKLDAHELAIQVLETQDEERMKEEGRKAWQLEVAERHRLEAEAQQRERERITAENLRRRARVFISTDEQRGRALIEKEVEDGYTDIMEAQKEFIKECERLAYEAFINSPEQLALAAERAKKEKKERLRLTREKKKFEKEQRDMIHSCTHGPQNGSVFVGKKPKQTCPRCRIRFDAELGYYVSMDAVPVPTRRSTVATGGDNGADKSRHNSVATQGTRKKSRASGLTLPPVPSAAGGAGEGVNKKGSVSTASRKRSGRDSSAVVPPPLSGKHVRSPTKGAKKKMADTPSPGGIHHDSPLSIVSNLGNSGHAPPEKGGGGDSLGHGKPKRLVEQMGYSSPIPSLGLGMQK